MFTPNSKTTSSRPTVSAFAVAAFGLVAPLGTYCFYAMVVLSPAAVVRVVTEKLLIENVEENTKIARNTFILARKQG